MDNKIKYLFFVGSGRTGSTLVGQLLNHHPNIAVTNEDRVLGRAIRANKKISKYIPKLISDAHDTMHPGVRQYTRPRHTLKWQRDWVDASKLKAVAKKEILYVGDKKQGGNTALLISNREAVLATLGNSYTPISVIRDPYQVLASYIKLNDDIKLSCEIVIRDMTVGHTFTREMSGIIMSYEQLLASPEQWCDNVCRHLGVSHSDAWKRLVAQIVTSNKSDYTLTESTKAYFESHPRFSEFLGMMGDYDF